MTEHHRTLIAGIGSSHGDDRVGWLVAELVRERLVRRFRPCPVCGIGVRLPGGARCGEARRITVPVDLLDQLDDVDQLHLVDACRTDAPAGTLERINWSVLAGENDKRRRLAAALSARASSHAWSVIDVLELAERTGRLPPSVTLWTISGQRFAAGDSLSQPLQLSALATSVWLLAEAIAPRSTRGGHGSHAHA